ncbi:O-antigen translocase [Kaistella flava (ex Peng et al. 2021)]|uniref:O-antigen translocase n=1 Tax=Kaistella flava (ex Peng et al. 2021) TaxID=2038776 RepID=A0A7M2Y973_9FLAO|nr:O-antigen translocase [Kaistella flava (ex Peng et al. 2021)]QOW10630.1 O-antigen translocase [Kaistella flava (ex Peng et al. 2021)]
MNQKSSYRTIFKATSLFGGVQVINIIVQIIRSKVIAVLLGPAGMGIAGLLTTALGLLGSLTNFGLGTSAVRDISEAHATGRNSRVAKVVTVLRRLVWMTGLLGLFLTFIAAPYLSNYTFGNQDYTLAFRWLSVTLLLNQLASGQKVLLQGMRKLKLMAKANVLGSVLGLLISAPLYYFYRIDGIVPAIIVSSILALVISWFYSRRLKIEPIEVSRNDTLHEGKSMLKMGFMLSLSGLITVGASYIIRAYISKTGSLEDVGLYTAGFAIVGSYVGLIFSAMSTDYYPRLSAVATDPKQANELISQQAETALLIIGPILCAFLIFANWAVILLYSSKFIPISGMIQWAALGMYFKAASWAIGFLFLAKGASKVFFWSELVSNGYMLLLNILGYMLFGLDGLGISFLISYILVLLQVYFISQKLYSFSFKKTFFKLIFIQLSLGILCFICNLILPSSWSYLLGIVLIAISCAYSFKEMDKRLNLKEAWTNLKKRKNG